MEEEEEGEAADWWVSGAAVDGGGVASMIPILVDATMASSDYCSSRRMISRRIYALAGLRGRKIDWKGRSPVPRRPSRPSSTA
jgi:hypothetical protein